MPESVEPRASKRVEIVALILGAGGLVVISSILLTFALLSWAYRQVDDTAMGIFLPYILIELLFVVISLWVAFKNNHWIKIKRKSGIFLTIVMSFFLVLGAFFRFSFYG